MPVAPLRAARALSTPRGKRGPPIRRLLVASCLLVAGLCIGPIGGAGASYSPATFNSNEAHDSRTETCVPLQAVPNLRYGDGVQTGFQPPTSTPVCPAGTSDPNNGCYWAFACILIDRRDLANGMFFHRGGEGGDDDKYGHVPTSDFSPGRTPSSTSFRFGRNGEACGASNVAGTTGHYFIRIRDLPLEMKYKAASSSNFKKYVDTYYQGSQQNRGIHYGYLTWNFLNNVDNPATDGSYVAGGGVVRTLIRQNQVFHRCDVTTLTMNSVTATGTPNGQVKAIYGKTLQGGYWFYGWIIHSHKYNYAHSYWDVETNGYRSAAAGEWISHLTACNC